MIDFNDKTQKDKLEEGDKNELTDMSETEKFRPYKFDTNENILENFDKLFKDYKIIYTPYKKVNLLMLIIY